MNKKNIILTLALAFFLVLAFTGNANAATMPQYLWADSSYFILSAADLGMLGSNEWELVVIADWPDVVNIGLAMRFYYPANQAFGISVLADGHYVMFGYYGIWSGEGSVAYGMSHLGSTWERILHTSLPTAQSSGDFLPEIE